MSKKKPSESAQPTDAKLGRPAGAVTKDRDIVDAVVVVGDCPKCGCTKPPKNKRLLRQGQATATIKGVTVGSYKHFTANCADCGQAFLYREFKAVK